MDRSNPRKARQAGGSVGEGFARRFSVPSTLRPIVAIVNASADLSRMLRAAFEVSDYTVVSLLAQQLGEPGTDFERFLDRHRPDVIVYDLAPPYEASLRLFNYLCATPAVERCALVLTSANAPCVADLVGTNARVAAIVGNPFDLDAIVRAADNAAHARVS